MNPPLISLVSDWLHLLKSWRHGKVCFVFDLSSDNKHIVFERVDVSHEVLRNDMRKVPVVSHIGQHRFHNLNTWERWKYKNAVIFGQFPNLVNCNSCGDFHPKWLSVRETHEHNTKSWNHTLHQPFNAVCGVKYIITPQGDYVNPLSP